MSFLVRPARSLDASAAGAILYQYQQQTDWLPKLYSEAELISYSGAMVDSGWVTVIEQQGQVTGFLARDGAEIRALYIASKVRRKRLGRLLMARAKREARQLKLNTFVANEPAQRFYLQQGFREIARGDGSGNEEGLPEITYQWRVEDERQEAAA